MRLALEFTVVSTVLNIEFFYLIRVDKMASIFYRYDQNTIYLNTIFFIILKQAKCMYSRGNILIISIGGSIETNGDCRMMT